MGHGSGCRVGSQRRETRAVDQNARVKHISGMMVKKTTIEHVLSTHQKKGKHKQKTASSIMDIRDLVAELPSYQIKDIFGCVCDDDTLRILHHFSITNYAI